MSTDAPKTPDCGCPSCIVARYFEEYVRAKGFSPEELERRHRVARERMVKGLCSFTECDQPRAFGEPLCEGHMASIDGEIRKRYGPVPEEN
jgi:hypothetical protein